MASAAPPARRSRACRSSTPGTAHSSSPYARTRWSGRSSGNIGVPVKVSSLARQRKLRGLSCGRVSA
ncbi:hypothetical protein ACFQYP_60090 [Nonomuraea antimicrobica]